MRAHTRFVSLAASLVAAAAIAPRPPPEAQTPAGLRDVMFVGNNWSGTASIVDAHDPMILKGGINLIPDKQQELNAIHWNPVKLFYFLAIRTGPGQGHDQFVDDMFSTPDGRFLAVSRPSFADVVWIDIAKAVAGRSDSIVVEQSINHYKQPCQGLPSGKRFLVSD